LRVTQSTSKCAILPASEAKALMKTVAVVLMGLCAAVGLRGDARHDRVPTAPGHFAAAAPPIMIWAWEEPEDLRGIIRGV
jgi:hypothetical protein